MKGNSLWKLQKKKLRWRCILYKIYKNNLEKIKNPNLIYPGQVFNIPIKEKNYMNKQKIFRQIWRFFERY